MFLKDTIEANKAIPKLESRIKELEQELISNEELKAIKEAKTEIEASVISINFDKEKLVLQEQLVSSVLEAKNKIAVLDSLYQNAMEYEQQIQTH